MYSRIHIVYSARRVPSHPTKGYIAIRGEREGGENQSGAPLNERAAVLTRASSVEYIRHVTAGE